MNGSVWVLIIATMLSFAVMSMVFFGLKYWHHVKHPSEDQIKETNRQRSEREKLKRETTEKVNAYMRGEKPSDSEKVPNGKRCGKYKKKNKKK
jgi:flagellar basal body-associated protein FliL